MGATFCWCLIQAAGEALNDVLKLSISTNVGPNEACSRKRAISSSKGKEWSKARNSYEKPDSGEGRIVSQVVPSQAKVKSANWPA
eukprot:scaffold3571_cov176-Amphora_coffeaeformis.AAC.10